METACGQEKKESTRNRRQPSRFVLRRSFHSPVTTTVDSKRKQKMIMKKTIVLMVAALMAAVVSARAADAKANWEKQCAKCHGADGKGDTKMGKKLEVKDYTDAKVQAAMKDDEMTKAITEGKKDKEGKVRMKPAENLTDDEIKALVAHVRSLKK